MESPQLNVSIEELSFNIFQRPLHPELFNIYSKRSMSTDHYQARIWVTGCSHVVTVFAGDLCLSELTCTPEQILPSRGLIESFKFKGPKSHKCTLSRGMSYMTDFQVEKMSSALYKQSHKDLEGFSRNRGIFVKYPKSENNGLQPFCYIDYEARQTELHMHTFAGYPDQQTIIKTQSLFDLH